MLDAGVRARDHPCGSVSQDKGVKENKNLKLSGSTEY